ncbi:MAG: dihydroneopterin aldolase [Verrucomicrobia bacterium]|nr:dihydroneopterin aldolase [Verrucomicrobiota bacterium]
MPATLSLVDLKLRCHLGVPVAERKRPQTVLCTAVFPAKTVDYHALGMLLQSEARRIPRKLLERLAVDLGRVACHRFRIPWIELELKKFVLPETRHVSLQARLSRKDLA